MKWIYKLMSTKAGWSVFVLRWTVGIIFFREGTGKLFGWFGNPGLEALLTFFRRLGIPFPGLNIYLVSCTELAAGALLLLGLFTRFAAFSLSVVMFVAIMTAHLEGGWEYPLSLLAACVTMMFLGGGNLSLDHFWTRKTVK